MKTGEKLLLVALGAAGGFIAAKYGKQIVTTAKENADKEHLEAIANDIKEHGKKVADSVKKSADSVKKSVADLRYEMEKGMFADLGDFDDIENYFMYKSDEDDVADTEEKVKTPKKKGYVTVPVVDTVPVEAPVAETVTAETNVNDVKTEKKASNVQSAAEVLKKRRAQNVNKARTKKTVKVEDAEPEKVENKVEEKTETVDTDKAE